MGMKMSRMDDIKRKQLVLCGHVQRKVGSRNEMGTYGKTKKREAENHM